MAVGLLCMLYASEYLKGWYLGPSDVISKARAGVSGMNWSIVPNSSHHSTYSIPFSWRTRFRAALELPGWLAMCSNTGKY